MAPPFAAVSAEQSDDWTEAMSGLPLLVSFPDEPGSVVLISKELRWSQEQLGLAHALYERRLPPLTDNNALPYMFGVSSKLISAMGVFPHRYYRIFEVRKRGGGSRRIEAPRRFLKVIQWWINDHILSRQQMPAYVVGFVKGKSIFDNGEQHAPGKNLMVVDIEDFFPSVPMAKVIQLFQSLNFPEPVSHQLARLCCLEERLPQGAPTSPAIANLVFLPADEELARLANGWACEYTRYADDLAFSGSRHFTNGDMLEVGGVLKRHGFIANTSKSRIVGAGARQIVTGLVVNVRPQPPRWKRHLWRAMFHRAWKHPYEFSDRVERLAGIAAFVNQFNPKLAEEYRGVAEEVLRRAPTG